MVSEPVKVESMCLTVMLSLPPRPLTVIDTAESTLKSVVSNVGPDNLMNPSGPPMSSRITFESDPTVRLKTRLVGVPSIEIGSKPVYVMFDVPLPFVRAIVPSFRFV